MEKLQENKSNFDKNIANSNLLQTTEIKENIKYNSLQNFELNPRRIWGTVVTKLRSINQMALFTACGEIRNVEINDDFVLVVNVKEKFLYSILTKTENYKKILELLKQIDNRLDLQINLIKNEDFCKENLEKLKNLFGKNLIVK